MTPGPNLLEPGSVPPADLVIARLALHDAAQASAAAAHALLPTAPDHSHSNLLWSSEHHAFRGRALPAGNRCALEPLTLQTVVLGPGGEARGFASAVGHTFEQVLGKLARVLRRAGESVPPQGLSAPGYELPDTPVRRGEPFAQPSRDHLQELARWFGLGHAALERVSRRRLGGSEVRIWPHHFDMAALRTLDEDVDPEEARSVGVGFSPGDGSYAEPYLYVSPWPAPPADALPELPAGRWHTQGFTSAVLTAGQIVGPDAAGRVDAFLEQAVSLALELLER
jgi:hypothetical protein